MTARRGPGELESEVLATLWSTDEPLTAAEVQAELGDDLAYSTVVTILTRLHDKGVLAREKRGRAYAYAPVADEAGLAARRMQEVLEAGPDRDAVLARFVSELPPDDEGVLRELLRSARRDG